MHLSVYSVDKSHLVGGDWAEKLGWSHLTFCLSPTIPCQPGGGNTDKVKSLLRVGSCKQMV